MQQNTYNAILNNLETELDFLEREIENVLEKSERGIQLSRKALKNARYIVVDRGFDSTEHEVFFFKHIKPKIYSNLIYYAKLFNIESKRPRGSSKSQIDYINCHIKKLQVYFNDNLDFYNYFRRGSTLFDEQYFLREKSDIRLCPDDFHFLIDEKFATSHDSTMATILAFDLLIIYLKCEIDKLENTPCAVNGLSSVRSKIVWTANKIDLIELIYALHSSKAINKGNIEIKDIARIIEYVFKIQLGDFYRAFLEIRMRKNRRTKFLDSLKENLIRRMDDTDN